MRSLDFQQLMCSKVKYAIERVMVVVVVVVVAVVVVVEVVMKWREKRLTKRHLPIIYACMYKLYLLT
jgi:hypothetical protein